MNMQLQQLALTLVFWCGLVVATYMGFSMGDEFHANISFFGCWAFSIIFAIFAFMKGTVTRPHVPWAFTTFVGYICHVVVLAMHIGFGNWWTAAVFVIGTICFWSLPRKYEPKKDESVVVTGGTPPPPQSSLKKFTKI